MSFWEHYTTALLALVLGLIGMWFTASLIIVSFSIYWRSPNSRKGMRHPSQSA